MRPLLVPRSMKIWAVAAKFYMLLKSSTQSSLRILPLQSSPLIFLICYSFGTYESAFYRTLTLSVIRVCLMRTLVTMKVRLFSLLMNLATCSTRPGLSVRFQLLHILQSPRHMMSFGLLAKFLELYPCFDVCGKRMHADDCLLSSTVIG